MSNSTSNDIIKAVANAPEQKLYIPGAGGGMVDLAFKRAERAVKNYDDNLILAQHEMTGDWVAFVEIPATDRMFPVIGFGRELPHPDEIRVILERHDTRRHGDKLIRQIQENNDRIQRELRAAGDEATEQVLEAAEYGIRKYTGRKTKVFIP